MFVCVCVCVCVGGFFLIWPLFIVLPEVEVSGEAVVITSLIRGTSIREATPRLLRLLTRRVPGRHAVSAAKVSLSFSLHLSRSLIPFDFTLFSPRSNSPCHSIVLSPSLSLSLSPSYPLTSLILYVCLHLSLPISVFNYLSISISFSLSLSFRDT